MRFYFEDFAGITGGGKFFANLLSPDYKRAVTLPRARRRREQEPSRTEKILVPNRNLKSEKPVNRKVSRTVIFFASAECETPFAFASSQRKTPLGFAAPDAGKRSALDNGAPSSNTIPMELFLEISIGGVTKQALLEKLEAAGIQFNAYAKILFDHPAFAPSKTPEKVRLAKLKPEHLHLPAAFSYQMLLERAFQQNLKPCPLYLAAFLRLEYSHQPEGPYLTVASPPLDANEDHPTGFYLRNFDSKLWLRGYQLIGEAEGPADNEFIFQI